MFNNEKERGVDNMMLFEVECECDGTWSESGRYSFDVYANREIDLDEAREIVHANPAYAENNGNGLGDVISIVDVTNDPYYDGANLTYVEGQHFSLDY